MAKYLCKTLTQIPSTTTRGLLAPLRLFIHGRAQSTQPDVTSSPPIPEPDVTVQKIEDAIHGFIVRKSAPDWLPFVPGSSYWVPPKLGSYGVADLVDKLENKLTHEELMSFATSRGWPCFQFYFKEPEASIWQHITDQEVMLFTTSGGWPSSDIFIKGASHTNGKEN